jgi:hypothetical protein
MLRPLFLAPPFAACNPSPRPPHPTPAPHQAAASALVESGHLHLLPHEVVDAITEAFGEALRPALLMQHSAWLAPL